MKKYITLEEAKKFIENFNGVIVGCKNLANLKEVRFENLNTRLGFAQFEASLYALSVEGETL